MTAIRTRKVTSSDSNDTWRRAAAITMAVLTTISTATPTKSSSFETWSPGRDWEKITDSNPTRTTFSSVSSDQRRELPARHAACSAAVSISSGSGSAASRSGWSGSGVRGRTTNQTTTARASSRPPSSQGAQAWSRRVSVMSSWATWIQYSCGSFTQTQIAAATTTQPDRLRRRGSQRVRTVS